MCFRCRCCCYHYDYMMKRWPTTALNARHIAKKTTTAMDDNHNDDDEKTYIYT